MKKYLPIFVLAFCFNFIWEHVHAVLYAGFMGGEVAEWVLTGATFLDAVFITLLGILFTRQKFFRRRLWLAVALGVLAGAVTELFALRVGLWAYTASMPIVPILGTGLSPTIQLGITAYATYKILFPDR